MVAVSYQDGKEISRDTLETAGAPSGIRLIPERAEAFAGFKGGRFKGNCMDGLMDALVEAGVLTQDQADAVAESMNK